MKESKLERVIHGVMAVLLAALCIVVMLGVLSRYMNHALVWTEEVARVLFLYLIFMSAINAVKDDTHFRVTLFIDRFPKAIKNVLLALCNLVCLYLLYQLFYGSWKLTLLNTQKLLPVTRLPYAFLYGIGFVTSVCMALIIIWQTFGFFRETAEMDSQKSNLQDKLEELKNGSDAL